MKDELREALEFDSLAEAEKITGKSYKDDDSVAWLGMALMQKNSEKRSALLFLNRDTDAYQQTIPEFLAILKDLGFEEVLKLEIPKTPDHFYVFWKPGLLIRLDTYNGRSINSGSVYFNLKAPFDTFDGCSHGPIPGFSDIRNGDKDIREGLREFLERPGEFISPWIYRPFLWMLHHEDTKVKGYSYEKINQERIAMLPEKVRKDIIS